MTLKKSRQSRFSVTPAARRRGRARFWRAFFCRVWAREALSKASVKMKGKKSGSLQRKKPRLKNSKRGARRRLPASAKDARKAGRKRKRKAGELSVILIASSCYSGARGIS